MIKYIASLVILFAGSLVIFEQCKSEDKGASPTPTATVPAELNAYFDDVFLASTGSQDAAQTIPIADGKPAKVIKDVKGTKDIFWGGSDKPSAMWPTPALYHADSFGGYITLPNLTNTVWVSKEFTSIPQPYDLYVVLRDLEAVNWESYFSVGLGLRNRSDHLQVGLTDRVISKGASIDMASGLFEYNKMSILRMRYDGGNTQVWINNVSVLPEKINIGGGAIYFIGYGTISHARQHDFYGMWIKFGTLSDADHADIYKRLSAIYNPGSAPAKPYASHIRAVWNGSGWDAQYNYESPDGTAEDKSKTEFQWYYHLQALDLDNTIAFDGSEAKKSTLVRAKFPTQFPALNATEIFVSVKVYDVKGNSWDHMMRSPFISNDIP